MFVLNSSWLRALGLSILLVMCGAPGYAQAVTDTLKEVKISGKKKKRVSQDERINTFSPGQKVTTIDSTTLLQYQSQSVANLMAQQTPVFVKSYGLNGLATLNFRGSSAAQSQVYWNGVPIQNAALGIADVSLLPVSLINKLHVIYGSSASMWGSGNVGGALLMESEQPRWDSSGGAFSVAMGAGSFGQYTAGGKYSANNSRWSFSANALVQRAKNNFNYTSFGERQEITNGDLRGIAVLPQIAYKMNKRNSIRLAVWYQNYYRQIPPALFESESKKERKDESVRVLLNWNQEGRRSSAYIRTAFMTDKMGFEDEVILQTTANTSYQYYLEPGIKKRWGQRHQLILFAPIQLSWMKQYTSTHYQSRYAVAAAYAYTDLEERFSGAVSVRGEQINNQSVMLPGVSASYALTRWLSVTGNVQKTYRAPTLNELYYDPGGNKDLKAEHGWGQDIGYKVQARLGSRGMLHHDAAVYNRRIHDWVLWLGGAIWTPHNIASVHSRGIETENLLTMAVGEWKLHLGVNTAYMVATTMSTYLPNDNSAGKQIPYTPHLNGQGNVGFTYRGLSFNYNQTYTSLRYVNIDETDLIAAYHTANLHVGYQLPMRTTALRFSVQLNNILDAEYQVVRARPMPGFNWVAGITLTSL